MCSGWWAICAACHPSSYWKLLAEKRRKFSRGTKAAVDNQCWSVHGVVGGGGPGRYLHTSQVLMSGKCRSLLKARNVKTLSRCIQSHLWEVSRESTLWGLGWRQSLGGDPDVPLSLVASVVISHLRPSSPAGRLCRVILYLSPPLTWLLRIPRSLGLRGSESSALALHGLT